MEAVDPGLIISLVSGLIAGFILPFGLKCAKWLSFVSCLLNAGMVLTFVVIESA
jgi:predicted benzoate:H+ symporter BenE